MSKTRGSRFSSSTGPPITDWYLISLSDWIRKRPFFSTASLDIHPVLPYFCIIKSPSASCLGATNAKVAQLVERDLAKVEVAGSNPVFRSTMKAPQLTVLFLYIPDLAGIAGMVESVDTPDLKS